MTFTNQYGRMLGFMHQAPDGFFVNLELVRQGYGPAAYFDYPGKERSIELKQVARNTGKGL